MPGHDLIHNGDGRYCSKCGCCWDNDEPVSEQCSLTPADEPAPPIVKQDYADLAAMQAWAARIMEREPDVIIGDGYLRRWWIIPRNEGCNVYLHEILRSDDDRALHDHPWENTSMVLAGEYIEHTPEGSFLRQAGQTVTRPATASHPLELPDSGRAISLFITGPKVREWGFHCPQGWRHWKAFVDPSNPFLKGPGCD